jgi:hypothetical protein
MTKKMKTRRTKLIGNPHLRVHPYQIQLEAMTPRLGQRLKPVALAIHLNQRSRKLREKVTICDDVIRGSDEREIMTALAGNDEVTGKEADDVIYRNDGQ